MKKFPTLFLIIALLLTACASRPGGEEQPTPPATQPVETEAPAGHTQPVFPEGQRLCMEVIPGDGFGKLLVSGQPSGSVPHVFSVSEVSIFLDGEKLDLGDAISAERISVEEMEAYARLDARHGHCTMEWANKNGVTVFVYHYDGFDIATYHDVYEAPDGSEMLYQRLNIATGEHFADVSASSVYVPSTIREDWGLGFDVVEADSGHLRVRVTQSGGQQFGTLYVEPGFDLFRITEQGYQENHYSTSALFLETNPFPIAAEAETELNIEWPKSCPALPAGNYSLHLRIGDHFDADALHPFTRDYTDQQYYDIPFTVP